MTATTAAPAVGSDQLNGLFIPPQPRILIELQQEQRAASPDLRRVVASVGADPGLAAGVLKVANSPAFGVKVTSISAAVNMLGLNRTFNIVTSLALKQQLSQKVQLDRFWDTAAETALACAIVARRVPGLSPDLAHMLGLFHECGVPILAMRFPNYKATLMAANRAVERKFTDVEDEIHGTNHAVVGYLVAKSWHLPDDVRESILVHHEPLTPVLTDARVPQPRRTLLAALKIGEFVAHSARRMTMLNGWDGGNGDACLDYLALSHTELEDVMEDFCEAKREMGLN